MITFYNPRRYFQLALYHKDCSFTTINYVLKESELKTDKERVKIVFFAMAELMSKYPILTNINSETVEVIVRKVSQERLLEYSMQGFDAVKTIEEHGIKFRYDTQVVSQLFHTLYEAWISLQGQSAEMQKQVIDIMLEGVIDQIL